MTEGFFFPGLNWLKKEKEELLKQGVLVSTCTMHSVHALLMHHFFNPFIFQLFVSINITKHTVITKYCTVLLSDIKYMYYYIFKIQNNIGGIQ